MQSNNAAATVSVAVGPTTSLSGIGILVGIILCILQGTGVLNIGWFWATFPFWICPATVLAIVVLVLLIGVFLLVTALLPDHRKKRH